MLLFIWFLLYFSCFYFVSSLTFKSSSVILEYNECTIKQQLCIFRKALIIYRNRSGKETNNVSFWHPHTFYRQRSRNHLYHLWHGKSSQQKGLKLLGISDHGPGTLASGTSSYFRSLPFYPRKRFGIDILYGVELNILDSAGHTDLSDELLNNLDYAIISMHRQNYRSGSVSQNTEAYINAIKHPAVKILGHCDDTHFPCRLWNAGKSSFTGKCYFWNKRSFPRTRRISGRHKSQCSQNPVSLSEISASCYFVQRQPRKRTCWRFHLCRRIRSPAHVSGNSYP